MKEELKKALIWVMQMSIIFCALLVFSAMTILFCKIMF